MRRSFWAKSSDDGYPPLATDRRCDVAVVGAGVAGMMVARRLAQQGQDVIVLEAQTLGAGTTGFSTAKITALHGAAYQAVERTRGAEAASQYAAANLAGLDEIAAAVDEYQLACGWTRLPAYT